MKASHIAALVTVNLTVLCLVWIIVTDYRRKTICYLLLGILLIWIVGAGYARVTWRGKVYQWVGPFSSKKW